VLPHRAVDSLAMSVSAFCLKGHKPGQRSVVDFILFVSACDTRERKLAVHAVY
jgi:hypothetical protein